ncbi:restriction endonuclease subunit S [Plesiomonas shigelloides]|uniref:restriction endonuclease subunit S n=1 Tax=Plesiomonas shigelloides TaxID=703 RepID=UPI0012622521|nr:restriction endonuclease subunit S [Plesiomonas shigelloides]KAB7684640.1 restriction endonuclease subunit S [Plesiomonas shigelloides]
MSVEMNVPEIRFKGFSDEWQSLNLDKITDVYDGTHQTPAYTKNGVMFLSAENIRSLTSQKFISEKAFKEEFKVYPQKNDVLMTRIGDVGTANVVETDDDKAYYVTLALLKYKQLSPYFLKSSIASPYVQRDIWLRTLHIAFPKKINMNEIKQVNVNCPPNSKESDKIGNYFQKLDSLINQHQQKHDKLSNIKKAMLEKMFPKQGETIPEIRFKGFSGKWEVKPLSEVAEVIDPHPSHRAPNAVENGVPFIGIGDISDSGIVDFKNVRIVPLHIYNEHSARYTIENGDFAYGRVASVGKIIDLSNNVGNRYTYSPTMAIVKPKSLRPAFLKSYLGTDVFKAHVDNKTSGSTRKSLGVQDFRNLPVLFPLVDEQTAIGSYFQKLDALINQHQQQITKLTNIKQACLNKMFV